jgi:excisionase family DNA binding protein
MCSNPTQKVNAMVPARKKQKGDDRWMSLVEAARTLAVSRQTILARAVKGELEAEHVAGRTVVSRESVERAVAAQ